MNSAYFDTLEQTRRLYTALIAVLASSEGSAELRRAEAAIATAIKTAPAKNASE